MRDMLSSTMVINIKDYFSWMRLSDAFNDLNLPGSEARVYYSTI